MNSDKLRPEDIVPWLLEAMDHAVPINNMPEDWYEFATGEKAGIVHYVEPEPEPEPEPEELDTEEKPESDLESELKELAWEPQSKMTVRRLSDHRIGRIDELIPGQWFVWLKQEDDQSITAAKATTYELVSEWEPWEIPMEEPVVKEQTSENEEIKVNMAMPEAPTTITDNEDEEGTNSSNT